MLQSIPTDLPRDKFAPLGAPSRCWSIAAVEGDLERLMRLHDHIGPQIRPRDRIIYHGNYLGAAGNKAVIDEILSFRRAVMAIPGMFAADIVCLRGQRESQWHKLLQLQLLPDPVGALNWMMAQGMEGTLLAYGTSAQDARFAASSGRVALARWTTQLRAVIRKHQGHEPFYNTLRRAAWSVGDSPLLFVHAGLDPSRPLAEQDESVIWDSAAFDTIHDAYLSFARIIRGYSPHLAGPFINGVTATLDGGCGRGGKLYAGCFDQNGTAIELVEA